MKKDKIKITFIESGVSAVAELRNDKCPEVIKSLIKVLPIQTTTFQAKWGGNEIWSVISNFSNYKKENETCFPSIGEILIVPQGGDKVCFDVWYDRGWAFGPNGFVSGAAIGSIVKNLDEFAKECSKIAVEGAKQIKIEKI